MSKRGYLGLVGLVAVTTILAQLLGPWTSMAVLAALAVAGVTLAMRDGTVLLNGQPLAEPYAWHAEPGVAPVDSAFAWQQPYLVQAIAGTRPATRNDWGPLVLPAGAYFVLGDNRDHSLDSRYWGFLRATDLLGRVRVGAK